MTDDAHRLLTAFRKVQRMSNKPAVEINLVLAVAGMDRMSAHEALRELSNGGYVAPIDKLTALG